MLHLTQTAKCFTSDIYSGWKWACNMTSTAQLWGHAYTFLDSSFNSEKSNFITSPLLPRLLFLSSRHHLGSNYSEHYETHRRETCWLLVIHHAEHYLCLMFSQINYHKFNLQSAISFVKPGWYEKNYLERRWTAQDIIMTDVKPAVLAVISRAR